MRRGSDMSRTVARARGRRTSVAMTLPTGQRLLSCASPGSTEGSSLRKFVGPVLCFLGTFLVAIGLLSQFYMGKALLKTPLDVDEIISVDGSAQVPNAKGKIQDTPVLAWSVYHVD